MLKEVRFASGLKAAAPSLAQEVRNEVQGFQCTDGSGYLILLGKERHDRG